jgi:hypothetical protein
MILYLAKLAWKDYPASGSISKLVAAENRHQSKNCGTYGHNEKRGKHAEDKREDQ